MQPAQQTAARCAHLQPPARCAKCLLTPASPEAAHPASLTVGHAWSYKLVVRPYVAGSCQSQQTSFDMDRDVGSYAVPMTLIIQWTKHSIQKFVSVTESKIELVAESSKL